jgi:two-component system chemotaxis sensor kinase CheA
VRLAVDIIHRKAPWDIAYSGYEPELRETRESIKRLYDMLEKNEADRAEFLGMMNTVASNMEIDALFESLLPNLIRHLKSNCGAFYLANNTAGKLELRSSVGFSNNIYREFDLTIGEGLVGMAATSKDVTLYNDLPGDSTFVTKTFLGQMSPRGIMMVPIINNDLLVGVLCLSSLYRYTQEQLDSVNLIKYYIGLAIGNCITYERSKRLTNELQFQNSLIQSLNDELETKVKHMSG